MTQPRYILVLEMEDGLAMDFVGALAGSPRKRFELTHPSGPLTLVAVDAAVVRGQEIEKQLADAAAIIVISHHMDSASVDELRKLLARLPADVFLPIAHAMHRDPGRAEFKLSCANCGQKLWVADSHEGRPGRCPGCKQTFLIPSQTRHLVSCLQLAEDVPVRTLVKGDTNSAVALVNELAARLEARVNATQAREKNTTMRIVIDGDLLR
jgi:DNA-directed RNA polymerase subunit RPC12/RpoP